MLASSSAASCRATYGRTVRVALACAVALLCLAAAAGSRPASGATPALAARAGTPAAHAWRRIPPAPSTLHGLTLASAWAGGRLVVVGQPEGGGAPAMGAAYDPSAHRWTPLFPPKPMGPYPGDRALWTGKRMIVMNPADTFVYDPRSDRWKRLRRGHPGLVTWTGHEVIAWGGGCCGDALKDGVAYNPATGRWRTLPRSPLAGSQHPEGVWTGRELLIFVGDRSPDTGKPWPARLARAAAYDPATNAWRRIARLPEERRGASMAWDGRELLVAGGRAVGVKGSLRADGFAFDPAANRWRRIAAMPSGREGAAAVWTGRRLVLVAGMRGAGRPSRQALTYDPLTDRWSALPPLPIRGRASATASLAGHDLVVWGGGPRGRGPLDGAILRDAAP